MNIELITGATFVAVIVNLIVLAFSYGKLSQKVEDVCRRVDRLENNRKPDGG